MSVAVRILNRGLEMVLADNVSFKEFLIGREARGEGLRCLFRILDRFLGGPVNGTDD